MRATQILPPTYRKIGTIDIRENQFLLLVLNLLAVIFMAAFGWLFFRAIFWLRSSESLQGLSLPQVHSVWDWVVLAAAILVLTVLHIILHEAIHGIFFWLFTRSRPRFAFRGAYAYAAAPDWYIPRNLFFITTLAPFVFITIAGLLIFRAAPVGWLVPTWFVITTNAAGAAGDLVVAGWLLRQPITCLANDRGDAVTLYKP